jgi:hypothetical protein
MVNKALEHEINLIELNPNLILDGCTKTYCWDHHHHPGANRKTPDVKVIKRFFFVADDK